MNAISLLYISVMNGSITLKRDAAPASAFTDGGYRRASLAYSRLYFCGLFDFLV